MKHALQVQLNLDSLLHQLIYKLLKKIFRLRILLNQIQKHNEFATCHRKPVVAEVSYRDGITKITIAKSSLTVVAKETKTILIRKKIVLKNVLECFVTEKISSIFVFTLSLVWISACPANEAGKPPTGCQWTYSQKSNGCRESLLNCTG